MLIWLCPRDLHHDSRAYPLLQQEGRARVPQIVEAHFGKAAFFRRTWKRWVTVGPSRGVPIEVVNKNPLSTQRSPANLASSSGPDGVRVRW
jgi:hypothetical protein